MSIPSNTGAGVTGLRIRSRFFLSGFFWRQFSIVSVRVKAASYKFSKNQQIFVELVGIKFPNEN